MKFIDKIKKLRYIYQHGYSWCKESNECNNFYGWLALVRT
jgi:hypothetical protein